MKRNNSPLFCALLVLGVILVQMPKASAQYGMTPAQGKTSEQEKSEPPPKEAAAKMTEALTAEFPDAAGITFKKMTSAGTNDVYGVQFTAKGNKMRGIVATDGTILETEEPADIKTFPDGANNAVRKAITGMGVKDLGVRLGRTYYELQKGATNELDIVRLPAPLLTYRADVQNNQGQPGKFSFKADGTPVEKPSWAQ
jgi:hypothetical protein